MVKIVTDTTACLPTEFARQHDIPVVPQVINFGTESYLEGVDIDLATFMARLKVEKELPKTAAPPVELFIDIFKKLVPLGEPILCIHPTGDLSGTVRSALVAAAEFPKADIRVLDTRLIAGALATLVELATTWAEAEESADVIEARLTALSPRCRVYFLVSTLEYLARGGRIGGAAALLGSVLQLKPILVLRNGRIDSYERERTQKRAVMRLQELVYEQCPHCAEGYLSVMHAGVPEEGQALADRLRERLGLASIPLYNVPPAIVTHGGPGILAVSFFVAGTVAQQPAASSSTEVG